ncbi:PMD domain-containing protein [Cephalotus follicularis]|uniref:PMD domain-containing protein n=1 Tax=Cephalotus follicularis TaxID=3775 RepID=A0A1Q3B0R1_CEPFO|nr:PMD domain-containing protein [Cephalotus follicularis]
MFRDKESLHILIIKWCSHTHTFVATWGPFIVMLEDVMALYHLPLLSKASPSHFKVRESEQEKIDDLFCLITMAGKHCSHIIPEGKTIPSTPPKLPYFNNWIRYFLKEVDKDNWTYEGEGFGNF